MTPLPAFSFETPAGWVDFANGWRRHDPDTWYVWTGYVGGVLIRYKSFGTYTQVYEIDGIDHALVMGLKPVAWRKAMLAAWDHVTLRPDNVHVTGDCLVQMPAQRGRERP